ncbi:hypothetical protein SteCoe_4 [Stentor coeruleus]|uniref:Cyclic nucleotide-binding domain-containing protein n=1 Tax=Stentor coeruleus TaxID=5963 RepID=A0A1R2D4Z0_9CILI|nr:hypothetical protein SteCoe_4 [Stentor coeruleus]
MSIDRKSSFISGLIDLLSLPPYKRTQIDIENIVKWTSHFKFFQELNEKEESSRLHTECCKVLSVQNYRTNDFICRRGDQGDAFFFILRGAVKILAQSEIPIKHQDDEDLHKLVRKNTEINDNPKRLSHQSTIRMSLDAENDDKEVATLVSGQTFGEMALVNDRPRYFSVQCTEPTTLGILKKSDYNIIARVQEKQVNDKIEFLRSLEPFKNWTRVAVYKLSYFFRNINFRKGNIVYKEGDFPSEIYIIKEGEFIFTQQYSINAGFKKATAEFGGLKKHIQESIVRKKNMKIVIKQKGDIFGYDEIYANKFVREFTCTCNSSNGEILAITDKNFAKKIAQPETLKFIEDNCASFRKWMSSRLENLKTTERFKDNLSFTPFSKIQINSREESKIIDKKPSAKQPPPPPSGTLPIILDKILAKSRTRTCSRKKISSAVRNVFETELNGTILSYSKNNYSRTINNSFSTYSPSPTRHLPSSFRKIL